MANSWVNNHLAVHGPADVVADFVAFTTGPNDEFEFIRLASPPKFLTLDDRLRWQLLFWNTCWFTVTKPVVHGSLSANFSFATANMSPLTLVRTAARLWPDAAFTISYVCEAANFSGQLVAQGTQTAVVRTGTYADLCDFMFDDRRGPRLQPRAPLAESVGLLSVATNERLDVLRQVVGVDGVSGLMTRLPELAAVGDYALLHSFVDNPAVSPEVAWELAVWAASGANCAATVYALLDATDALKSAIGVLFFNFCTLLVPAHISLSGDAIPFISSSTARDLVTARATLFHDFRVKSFPVWLSSAQALAGEWAAGSVGDMLATAKLLTFS